MSHPPISTSYSSCPIAPTPWPPNLINWLTKRSLYSTANYLHTLVQTQANFPQCLTCLICISCSLHLPLLYILSNTQHTFQYIETHTITTITSKTRKCGCQKTRQDALKGVTSQPCHLSNSLLIITTRNDDNALGKSSFTTKRCQLCQTFPLENNFPLGCECSGNIFTTWMKKFRTNFEAVT